jgi:two-component system sensor histidine kinase KdpD
MDWRALDWRTWSPKTRRLALGLAAGVLLPLASALIARALDTYLDVRAPSMTFLCSVILAAIWFGRRVGLATALFAFFIYNFYLTEPHYTFGFAGFDDVLTLLIFIGTAALIGGLTGNLHDQRERAQAQVEIFSSLFALSRKMAEQTSDEGAFALLASGVRQIAAREAVVYAVDADGGLQRVCCEPEGMSGDAILDGAAAQLVRAGVTEAEAARDWRLLVLRIGERPAALLAWRPAVMVARAEHAIAVRLMADLTANAIERRRYMQRQVEVEAIAETDRLRTALMSSMSHDFRTPLSTILTSATSLQAYGDQFNAATRADLLTSIQEEAERLNRFIGNILDMTRLDSGALKPRQDWIDPLEVFDNVRERVEKRLGARRLRIAAPAAVSSIRVDALLLEQAVLNVVENALVHTSPDCEIRLGADYSGRTVCIWVEDDGPGVPAGELSQIFDKFHRLKSPQNTQGAGLGLAISKGFTEAMHGDVRACHGEGGRGLRIEFEFPQHAALETS